MICEYSVFQSNHCKISPEQYLGYRFPPPFIAYSWKEKVVPFTIKKNPLAKNSPNVWIFAIVSNLQVYAYSSGGLGVFFPFASSPAAAFSFAFSFTFSFSFSREVTISSGRRFRLVSAIMTEKCLSNFSSI